MKLKKNILLCLFFSSFLVACGGDDSSSSSSSGDTPTPSPADRPGEITGLGEWAGDFQGTPFTLPSGVVSNGEIRGVHGAIETLNASSAEKKGKIQSPKNVDIFQSAMKADFIGASGKYDEVVGSGYDVTLRIPLVNTNPVATKVVFPVRLVVKSKSAAYQNGILLKETSVTIPAGTEYTVILVMYCGNLSRAASASSAVYEWAVISESPTLKDLTDRLINKKINMEEFADSETVSYYESYSAMANILWNLTDRGIALTEVDKQWIAALPNSR